MRNRKFSSPKIIDQIIVQTDQTTNFADEIFNKKQRFYRHVFRNCRDYDPYAR